MGLGRTTRFAPLPPGARRVSVMRSGPAGMKALAPSPGLVRAFLACKARLIRGGLTGQAAHAAAARELGYRARYLAEIRGRPGAMDALRALAAEARHRDVYLMCMCPYRTRQRACHTYHLLDLARQLAPGLRLIAEPRPLPRGQPGRSGAPPLRKRSRQSRPPAARTPRTRTTRAGG